MKIGPLWNCIPVQLAAHWHQTNHGDTVGLPSPDTDLPALSHPLRHRLALLSVALIVSWQSHVAVVPGLQTVDLFSPLCGAPRCSPRCCQQSIVRPFRDVLPGHPAIPIYC